MRIITSQEAQGLIERGEVVSLDVRTKDEFASGHIAGAMNIDFYKSDFADEIKKLDKSKSYIVNCQSGGRSGKTVSLMDELGFSLSANLEGGIMAWKVAGLPVEK